MGQGANKSSLSIFIYNKKLLINNNLKFKIMGLDMYLTKKNYVKNWDHNPPEEKFEITVKKGGNDSNIKPQRISYVIEEIAYWRKFNALHGWIIDNCNNGDDPNASKDIYLSNENVKLLLETLNQALDIINNSKETKTNEKDFFSGKKFEYTVFDCAEKINEIFPPTEGFFFGSTAIDSYFKQNVEYSIEVFEEVLSDMENDDSEFYYSCSW
jgi:hypothetical protein